MATAEIPPLELELVPPRLRILFAILRAAPWTEIKSAVACIAVVLTGAWLAIAAAFRVAVDVGALDSWLLFLTGAWGIASVAQGWQRSTSAKVAAIAAAAEKVTP